MSGGGASSGGEPRGRSASDPRDAVVPEASRAEVDRDADRARRRRRHARGRSSEWRAALLLIVKGYRILARRHRTPLGEIDIVARRGRRLAFVEVKARPTFEACEAAIVPQSARRIRRAAELWLARYPAHQQCDIGFDVVFVVPRRLPRHIENGL